MYKHTEAHINKHTQTNTLCKRLQKINKEYICKCGRGKSVTTEKEHDRSAALLLRRWGFWFIIETVAFSLFAYTSAYIRYVSH